jgi:hypothetical protein
MKISILPNKNILCNTLSKMILQIRRIILLLFTFFLFDLVIFSQSYSSKNDYTGAGKYWAKLKIVDNAASKTFFTHTSIEFEIKDFEQ